MEDWSLAVERAAGQVDNVERLSITSDGSSPMKVVRLVGVRIGNALLSTVDSNIPQEACGALGRSTAEALRDLRSRDA